MPSSATDEKVKISATDTTAGYIEDKLVNGDGISFDTSSGNEQLTINADIFLTTISGNLMPVYEDTNRNKILSVEIMTAVFSESRLNSTEWMSIGAATDALSSYVMPFDGTVVGAFGQTSDSASQTIDLYVNGTATNGVLTFTGSGDQAQINNTLDINFTAGDKIRLKGGGGSTMQDTNIELRIKWRA